MGKSITSSSNDKQFDFSDQNKKSGSRVRTEKTKERNRQSAKLTRYKEMYLKQYLKCLPYFYTISHNELTAKQKAKNHAKQQLLELERKSKETTESDDFMLIGKEIQKKFQNFIANVTSKSFEQLFSLSTKKLLDNSEYALTVSNPNQKPQNMKEEMKVERTTSGMTYMTENLGNLQIFHVSDGVVNVETQAKTFLRFQVLQSSNPIGRLPCYRPKLRTRCGLKAM